MLILTFVLLAAHITVLVAFFGFQTSAGRIPSFEFPYPIFGFSERLDVQVFGLWFLDFQISRFL